MKLQPPPRIEVEKSFNEFVKEFGGELVSELMPSNPGYNADYLFRNQAEPVVAELKCLEKDLFSDEKFQEKLSLLHLDWVQRGLVEPSDSEFVQIDTSRLPHECQMDVLKLVKKSIEPVVKKANKQIGATRAYFNIPHAKGLLLLVNDNNYGLEPYSLIGTIGWIFEHQDKACINSLLFFTVNMRANVPGVKEEAILWVDAVRPKFEPVSGDFLRELQEGWFAFYDEKVGQKIPIITQEDHDVLRQTTNIRKSPFNQEFALFRDVDQGLNTRLEAKKYYWQPQTGFAYYCDCIESVGAGMFLVEGYNKGELTRSGKFYVTKQLDNCFVEVKDEDRLKLLVKLREELMRMEERNKRGKNQ